MRAVGLFFEVVVEVLFVIVLGYFLLFSPPQKCHGCLFFLN